MLAQRRQFCCRSLKAFGVSNFLVVKQVVALAGGPFIFNLGHGILPETPIAHVERFAAGTSPRKRQHQLSRIRSTGHFEADTFGFPPISKASVAMGSTPSARPWLTT
jgi:hypothetical protein